MIQEAIQKSNCCTFFLWKILLQNRIPTLEKENSNSYENIICTRKRCNIGTRRTCQALCSLWREFFTASSSLMIPSVNILHEGNSWVQDTPILRSEAIQSVFLLYDEESPMVCSSFSSSTDRRVSTASIVLLRRARTTNSRRLNPSLNLLSRDTLKFVLFEIGLKRFKFGFLCSLKHRK